MADNIRKPARARRLKRAAIITASVSTVALVVFVVISFLPKGNDAFSIRIDDLAKRQDEDNHFRMSRGWSEGESDDPEVNEDVTYIKGKSLDSMITTEASEVEAYLNGLEEFKAQQNYESTSVDKDGNIITDKGYALVYTIYLTNYSPDKEQKLKYSVNADSYYDTTTNPILDYLRIIIQTQIVDSNEAPKNVYYGKSHNAKETIHYVNETNDNREPISYAYQIPNEKGHEKDEQDREYQRIISDFSSNGNDGYCEPFSALTINNDSLISGVEFTIPPEKTLRFTYVSYFEGWDPDCHGQNPSNSYILLSLHFGI